MPRRFGPASWIAVAMIALEFMIVHKFWWPKFQGLVMPPAVYTCILLLASAYVIVISYHFLPRMAVTVKKS